LELAAIPVALRQALSQRAAMNLNRLAAALVAAALALAFWCWCDRPVAVSESWTGPLRSVSFAPYRGHQDPIDQDIPPPAQVEADLKSLVGHVEGIRTYGTTRGLEIVGNEVLLRNDLPADRLIEQIRKVKAAVRQPVSYADVWVFFLKHPEVARELDFITIHVLPFWEDEPLAVEQAEAHMMRAVQAIRAAFPGKPILIGETGWPSMGRDRGAAAVNTVNEARYVRAMPGIAERNGLDYNIVEAFDQPWKASLENTVGANWGILDGDRVPKFAMRGPVVEVADWRLRAAVAVVAGFLTLILFGRSVAGFGAALTLALLCQFLAWLATTTGFHVSAVSYKWWQEAWAVVRAGVPAVFACAIAAQAAGILDRRPRASDPWRSQVLAIAFALYAMVWTILLVVDGRYRDIPEIDFLVPSLGVAALIIVRIGTRAWAGQDAFRALSFDDLFPQSMRALGDSRHRPLLILLTLGLVAAAILSPISEAVALAQGEDFARDHPTWADRWPLLIRATFANREMLLWAFLQLVMAIPYAVAALRRSKKD
jgi:exo-beta-1,3-glucanase (GH17 family)